MASERENRVAASQLPAAWGIRVSNRAAWNVIHRMGEADLWLTWGMLLFMDPDMACEHKHFVTPQGCLVVRAEAAESNHGMHAVQLSCVPPQEANPAQAMTYTSMWQSAFLLAASQDTFDTLIHAAFLRRQHGEKFAMSRRTFIAPRLSARLSSSCTLEDLMDRVMAVADAHDITRSKQYMSQFRLDTRAAQTEHLVALTAGDAPAAQKDCKWEPLLCAPADLSDSVWGGIDALWMEDEDESKADNSSP